MESGTRAPLGRGPSMHALPVSYDPRAVESDTRAFWTARGLPPADLPLGPPGGPLVRLVTGPIPGGPPDLATSLRLAYLDAEARWLSRTGRRVSGVLRAPLRPPPDALPAPSLEGLGVWFGGGALSAAGEREAALRRTLVERLASDRILLSRSVPVQVCPNCRRPNSPESVIYQPETGSAYLVRFPLAGTEPKLTLLVWTDAAWRLLATSALLVNPKLTYVVLRRSGAGAEAERVVCVRAGLERLARWLPETAWEVLEERPGSALAGAAYVHPLAVEQPALANLPAPGGTVLASDDVEDLGTGILTLTPAHGVVDAEVAHRVGLPGWPVLGADGTMTRSILHKYAGLSREDAESFILRDLIDDGAIFAQLSVRRGVPRCARCGEALLWTPARVWSLDPGHLPPERLQLFRRVLPGSVVAEPRASLPWPVSEFLADASTDGAVALAECSQCELMAPETATGACECGGRRAVAYRRLLPEFEEAIAAWATVDTFPDGTAVRLVVPERRRGPALLHHLVAMHAARRRPGEVRLVPVPTVPALDQAAGDGDAIDAVRSALLRSRRPEAGRLTLESARRQDAARLRRLWATAREILDRSLAAGQGIDLGAVTVHYSSLLEEDRAFLSTFERLRLEVQRDFEGDRFPDGLDRLLRFFEEELRRGYLRMVDGRLQLAGVPPPKQSALRVLHYVVPTWVGLYASAAPFTAEAVFRAFLGDGASVFTSALPPAQEGWIDAALETSYARWRSIVAAVDRARPSLGLGRSERLPGVAVVVAEEELGASLRAQLPILARLLGAESVEVGSPGHPWEGRRIEVRPRLPEIQKAFGLRAARIVRLLQGLPAKKLQDGLKSGGLSVVLDGGTLTLTPGMFEVAEGLPPGTVPVPWAGGQVYLTVPPAAAEAVAGPQPILSLDAHRLLASVQRRLGAAPLDASVPEIVVRVAGPIREEIATQSVALARRLHVPKLRLDLDDERLPPEETHHGTTGRGVPWAVWIPGLPRPPRTPKAHRKSAGRRRAPTPRTAPAVPEDQLEYLNEEHRARELAIRTLLEELDASPAGPILGPTKLGGLWDLGFHDRAALAAAPFDQVAALPGFGDDVARALIESLGGSAPARPPWIPKRRAESVLEAPPANGGGATESAAEPATLAIEPAAPEPSVGIAPPSASPPGPPPPPLVPSTPSRRAEPVRRGALLSAEPPVPPAELPVPPPPVPSLVVPPPPRAPDPAPAPAPARALDDAPVAEAALASTGSEPAEAPGPGEEETEAVPPEPPAEPSAEVTERTDAEPMEPELEETPTAPAGSSGLDSPAIEIADDAGTHETSPGPNPPEAAEDPTAPLEEEEELEPPPSELPGTPEVAEAAGPVPGGPTPESGEIEPTEADPAEAPAVPDVAVPDPTPVEAGGAPVESEEGIRLLEGVSPEEAWTPFLEATASGHRGLCLTRESPDRVRLRLRHQDVEVAPISSLPRPGNVRPSDLTGLTQRILTGLTERQVSVVLFEGVEYLVSLHSAERSLPALREIDRVARERHARVWVPLNADLLPEPELQRLRAGVDSRVAPAAAPGA